MQLALPSLGGEVRVRAMRRTNRLASGLLVLFLAAYYIEVHVFRLPDMRFLPRSPAKDLLLLVPFFLLVFLSRWAMFPAVRAARQLACGAGEYLRFQARAMAVFTLPPLAYVLLFRWVLFRSRWFMELVTAHPGLLLVGAAVTILILLLGAPILVRYLFPRVPLARYLDESAWQRLQARLAELSKATGARLGPIFVWRTGAMRIGNAAVAGLLSRTQRIYVSDVLLARLGEHELAAVLAHEMGHQRMKHPLLSYVLALSAIASITLTLILLDPLVDDSAPSQVLHHLLVLGLNAGYVATMLRFSLHRFEYQADAVAAEAVGGAGPFVGALHRLLSLNAVPASQGSITHPSAARRFAALQALPTSEARQAWLHRERRRNRLFAVLAGVLVAAAIVVLEMS